MTQEYGYLGAVDVGTGRAPNLQSNGEPIYTPAAENRWAKELQSDDGKYRFLKGGSASGRGVGNVFDATLADNFTVLCLCRGISLASYPYTTSKIAAGSTVGWQLNYAPQSTSTGIFTRIDHSIGSNTSYIPTNTKSAKDLAWHWHGLSINGLSVRQYVDTLVTAATRTAGDLTNTQSLILSASSGYRYIAATLIYNRVLTDQEVSNIMLGKQMPKEVSGLVGYYKFNESHGNTSGQCTDYSGQGNHLTYSGAVWEKFDPTSTAKTNFASGQPYVLRSQINPANWWERRPPAIADPERMGCLWSVAPATSVLHAPVMDVAELTIDAWIKPISSNGNFTVIDKGVNQYRFDIQQGGKIITLYRDSATAIITPAKPFPLHKWTKITVTHDLTTVTFYANGVSIGSVPFTSVGTGSSNIAIGGAATGRVVALRSIRLFSRALSAAEVNELFLTDKISDRSGLVGEWLMNTPHSTTIADTSGNGLNTTTTNPLLLDSPYRVNRRKRFGKQLKPTRAVLSKAYTNCPAIVGARYITVSAWVNPVGLFSTSSFIIGLKTSISNAAFFIGGAAPEYVGVFARSGTGDSVQSVLGAGAIGRWSRRTWQLVSAEVDYTAKEVRIYQNGVLAKVATGLVFANNVYTDVGTPTIEIGNSSVETASVDDIRIYNRALTAQEHYNLYLDQAPRNGLVAEYKFDGDTTNCKDTSGNGFDATWSGITLANYVQEL